MRAEIYPKIIPYLTKVVYAIGFLVVGRAITKIIAGKVAHSIISQNPTPSAKKSAEVIYNMIMTGVMVMLILSSVSIVGINITLLVGGLGLAIGYAMENILGNIFASIMIVTNKKYRIGDVVKIGGNLNILGEIEKVNTRTTVLKTYDKQHIIIPNLTMIRSPITPFSKTQLVKCQGTIQVERDAHIEPIKSLMMQVINDHPATIANEYTTVLLSHYSESGKNLVYYYYYNPSNEQKLGKLKYISEINAKIHQTLRQHNITIPIPQRVLDVSKIIA